MKPSTTRKKWFPSLGNLLVEDEEHLLFGLGSEGHRAFAVDLEPLGVERMTAREEAGVPASVLLEDEGAPTLVDEMVLLVEPVAAREGKVMVSARAFCIAVATTEGT